MALSLFFRGLVIGLSIAAPVGPIGVLCIRRTLALTLTYPLSILSFAAVFAGLGLGADAGAGGYASAAVIVVGVFLGSALWWLSLSTGVGLLRSRLSNRAMRWVSRQKKRPGLPAQNGLTGLVD